MAAIRSRGNKDTELKLAAILRAVGITGWRRHQRLPGRPDFAFRAARLAIFVDGCFWHGCPAHATWPKQNAEFWRAKIEANMARDKDTYERLRAEGWKVIRVWAHEEPKVAARRIAYIVELRRERMRRA